MNPPQTHYVLGWLIVLASHNWPVILAGTGTLAASVAVWRHPSRRRLALLYGSALLACAYEYDKHVGPRLQDAANYLLMFELHWLNVPVWYVVGPIGTATITLAGLGFLAYALAARTRRSSAGALIVGKE